jgi:hypothetical protein
VSIAVLVPDLIVALDRAIAASDLATARTLNDRIYPLATAIYGTAPSVHANARLKACLKLMGKISNDAVRPPVGPLPPGEIAMLSAALAEAGVVAAPSPAEGSVVAAPSIAEAGVVAAPSRASSARVHVAREHDSPPIHRRKELAK